MFIFFVINLIFSFLLGYQYEQYQIKITYPAEIIFDIESNLTTILSVSIDNKNFARTAKHTKCGRW